MNANYSTRRVQSPTTRRGSAKVCVLGREGGGEAVLFGLEQNISKCYLFAIG